MSENFCVKCDETICEDSNTKAIKCSNDKCNKSLHYTCSQFKMSELKFLESNKNNLKWFCDGCSIQDKTGLSN